MPADNQILEQAPPNIAEAPDRFHPFLVKELRRSLKGKGFLIGLAAFLVGMSIVTQVMIGESNSFGRIDDDIWGWVLFLQSIYFIYIIPFFGAQSDDQEKDGSMMDLLRMTAMSPMSIVVGRWSTIVFFVAVYGIMMVPYYLLRYFLGGYNVTQGLAILGATLLASLFVGAWVTASTYLFTKRMRIGLNVLLFFFGWGIIVNTFRFGSSASFNSNAWEWLGLISFVLLSVAVLLGLGANGLASPVQRTALWVRVPLACIFALFVGFAWYTLDEEYAVFSVFVLLGAFLLMCLEDPVLPTERIFADRGKVSRFRGVGKAVKYPGLGYGFWPWLVGVFVFTALYLISDSKWLDLEIAYFAMCTFSVIAWGYFLAIVLPKRLSHTVAVVIGMAIVVGINVVVLLVGLAVDNMGINASDFLTLWLPLAVIVELLDSKSNINEWIVGGYTIVSLLAIVILALKQRSRLFKEEMALQG